MTEVKLTPLKFGDNFPTKGFLILRIIEEANLYGVHIAFKRSDSFHVDVCGLNGDTFCVHANKKRNVGWSVSVCQVRIDGLSCPPLPLPLVALQLLMPLPAEEPTVEDNDEHDFKNPVEEMRQRHHYDGCSAATTCTSSSSLPGIAASADDKTAGAKTRRRPLPPWTSLLVPRSAGAPLQMPWTSLLGGRGCKDIDNDSNEGNQCR